jgi:hypothetical protein
MYVSAERLDLANQTVRETFEQCSIVWQAIPHWDTGDPGQIRVSDGIVKKPDFLTLKPQEVPFQVTLAEANAPIPDLLLTEVMAATKTLAKKVDDDVLNKLHTAKGAKTITTETEPGGLQDSLIDARAAVEDAGYRAPSCLVTNTAGLKVLNQLVEGYYNILQQTLLAANINSLYRSQPLNAPNEETRFILIGRRRRIAQGAAAEASPGEEPVDLAVSLLPSLEVVGETSSGGVEFSARIRYATRITDATGLVAVNAV